MISATAALVQPGGEGGLMTDECEIGNVACLNFSACCDGLTKTEPPPSSQPWISPMTKAAVATRPTSFAHQFWLGTAAAALAALAVLAPGKARAAMPFDGHWRVSIQTLSGTCDRSYNFNVSIADGRLDGANGALLGTVNAKGGLNAMIGGGERRGSASGKLAGNAGSGRWTGVSSGSPCSGRWTAQRG